MKAYKFLYEGRVGPFSGVAWPEGRFIESEVALTICRAGIHACRLHDLAYWLADELWEIELDGEIQEFDMKVVGRRGRLVKKITEWAASSKEEFSQECVRRTALHAAAQMRAAGLDQAAGLLDSARTVAEVTAMTAQAAEAVADAGSVEALRLVGYVADAVGGYGVESPAVMAYIAAHAADSRTNHSAHDPFVDERQEQARWLTQRLHLG